MNTISKVSAAVAGVALVWLGMPGQVSAATLSLEGVQRIDTAPSTPVNLTTQGAVDWAYWQTTASGLAAPLAPTNEKLGATPIGSLGVVGGGTLRGPDAATTLGAELYSYTDGTSTASATNVTLGGLVFNGALGTNAVGKGVSLSIAGTPTADRYVTLYFGGFGATGLLTATLNGVAVPLTQSSQVYPGSAPKAEEAYTLKFRPDSAADLLTVSYAATSVSDSTNGHVGIQAVTVSTVSPIPEPASLGLAGVAVVGLLARRGGRRRA